jgi:serine phosphatase RsbU (regulator of sigma subunit)
MNQINDSLTELSCDRRINEQRLIVEHAVNRILSVSKTYLEAAPRIAEALCKCFGWDMGIVWIIDRNRCELRFFNIWHSASIDIGSFEQDLRNRFFVHGEGLPGRVWASGCSEWVPNVNHAQQAHGEQIAAEAGVKGAIAFPILKDGSLLSVLECFSCHDLQSPDEQLLEMMMSVTGNISQFIGCREAERQLYKQEIDRSLAREIQQGLLPQSIPILPGLEICGRSIAPNCVGGDLYDFIPLPAAGRDCFAIVVADVCGHGVAAALLAAQAHALLQGLSLTNADVATLLQLANRCLCKNPSGQFVTALLVMIDPHKRLIQYAGAGHLPGYVVNSNGELRSILPSLGVPLGIDPALTIPLSTDCLESGDTILLLTDGIIEAASGTGSLFGVERTLEIVRRCRQHTPDELLTALFAAVSKFSEGNCEDDRTAVIIKANEILSSSAATAESIEVGLFHTNELESGFHADDESAHRKSLRDIALRIIERQSDRNPQRLTV